MGFSASLDVRRGFILQGYGNYDRAKLGIEQEVNKMDNLKEISFFCYYEGNVTKHYRKMRVEDIPEWMKAYKYTHPLVRKISAMVNVDGWKVTSEEMPF